MSPVLKIDWFKFASTSQKTTQIWLLSRHQFGDSVLVPQTSETTVDDVAKCRLFSQAIPVLNFDTTF